MSHPPGGVSPKSDSFALLNGMGMVLCFLLVPAVLLHLGFESFLALKISNRKRQIVTRLGRHLDHLSRYQKEEYFYHDLLDLLFKRAEKAADPKAYLRAAIDRLKKVYPKWFQFIVWDGQGRLIPELTDETGFRYVLRKVWSALRAVVDNINSSEPAPLAEIRELVDNRRIIQSYLGRILVLEHLHLPYRRNPPPQLILADFSADRAYLWYHLGTRVGILCFISRDAIGGNESLKKIADLANAVAPAAMGIGYSRADNPDGAYLPAKTRFRKELVAGVRLFESSTEPLLETPHYFLLVRMLTPHFRAFAYWRKEPLLEDPGQFRKLAAAKGILLFVPGFLVLYLLLGLRRELISIRWKLAALFLFANGLPLLVLAFLGYDYLQQRRIALFHEIQAEGKDLFSRFEGGYSHLRQGLGERLNSMTARINTTFAEKKFPEADMDRFMSEIETLRPSGAFLVASSGRRLRSYTPPRVGRERYDLSYVTMLAGMTTRFFNGDLRVVDEQVVGLTTLAAANPALEFLQRSIAFRGLVHRHHMGTEPSWACWQTIGDMKRQHFDYLLMIFWSEMNMQNLFLERHLARLDTNALGVRVFAQTARSEEVFPRGPVVDRGVRALLRQVLDRGESRLESISVDGKEYFAFGFTGQTLQEVALIGLYPLSRIREILETLQRNFLLFAGVSLVLAFSIGQALARQFIDPIHALGATAHAIRQRNFHHRLPPLAADEFGRMGEVFNHVLAGLHELEVARVVQESLFPESSLDQGNMRLYGCNVAMTELGGDYFDFFPVDTHRIAVIIGDVAGHGVAAAMIMAMAKAGVFLSADLLAEPVKVIQEVHTILAGLKRRSIRRMMTFQILLLNTDDGSLSIANAGHCYPLHITRQPGDAAYDAGYDAAYVEVAGTPLGISKRVQVGSLAMRLLGGETLVLYTDGIVEAPGPDGHMLGYPGFRALAAETRQADPEAHYQAIFKRHKQWSPEAGDDITMVMIACRESAADA